MQRHQQISLRQPQATSIARAHGFNRESVDTFSKLLQDILQENSIPPTRIFNMDETGLTTVQKPQRVIAQKGKAQVGAITSAERGVNTTCVCCMSAAGQYIPPMILFKRMRMKDELKDGAPPGSLVLCNASGWMEQDMFLAWLNHFIASVKPTKDMSVLLIMDGHCSHTRNLDAINLARDSGVIMLSLPPHTTHRLQPLDVAFFRPLSIYYNQATDRWLRQHPGRGVSVFQVSQLFGQAYAKAATMTTAINGFAKCGIWPCNMDVFEDYQFAPSELNTRVESDQHDDHAVPTSDGQSSTVLPISQVNDQSVGEGLPVTTATTATTSSTTTGPSVAESSVVRTVPDGRCFFRSIAVALHCELQTSERNDDGEIIDQMMCLLEKSEADSVRAKTVCTMIENFEQYRDIVGDTVNADMPPTVRYACLKDRIAAMADSKTMPGEIEIIATSRALNKTICIVNGTNQVISRYGDTGHEQDVLHVQFTSLGEDVGHYNIVAHENVRDDCTVSSPSMPSHATHGKRTIADLSPIPTQQAKVRRKTARTTESCILTSSPYKKKLSASKDNIRRKAVHDKTTRKGNTRKKMVRPNTKRDAQDNWFCVICEESFKEDMVQCQRCLRWVHLQCANDPGAQYVCDFCLL